MSHYTLAHLEEAPRNELHDLLHLTAAEISRNTLPAECLRCRFYFACRGECPKHRFAIGSDGYRKNSLCEGLYAYFNHVEPYMDYMKSLLLQKQAPSWVMPFARHRMGLPF